MSPSSWDSKAAMPDSAATRRVDAAGWERLAEDVTAGRTTLVDLWGDAGVMRMAVLDHDRTRIDIAALLCPDGAFPSVGRRHTPALRLERTARDLYGLEPRGGPDQRRWLDHGRWQVREPLGRREPHDPVGDRYQFLPVEGEGLHEIPVGPVHAGIIEPGHFRFTCSGETVVRLEERLGYVHKGIEGLMRGADLDRGAKLAGRV